MRRRAVVVTLAVCYIANLCIEYLSTYNVVIGHLVSHVLEFNTNDGLSCRVICV